ncbi:MAG: helix-turn-helix domain-containing protein [Kaiparowitsia implicata GSE-PSE-MK54-09C]|jgi:transposase|nr:helix-turn-helix domain-containing protein [Kaiparowitsia implicata GSE-PSE-MK54-09C]
MSGVLKIDISETTEELKAVLAQQQRASQRSKVQVLWWLKTRQAAGIDPLAERSGYHRTTVSRWLSNYRRSGLDSLVQVAPRCGRPRAITGDVLAALERELQEPEGFRSYGEVQQWLAAVYDQQVPYKTVHKTVRYGLKAQLKVPRPVSEKQTPGAVESFQQTLDSSCAT